ncbi:hypothetical protein NDU88_002371 [Pleurodeles waltl]|uniref:Uncharacterized protein n=1 Tax=Pleurodeles waltl TaxID=8319 RepID=A0AAV7NDI3_PLEWA|nr:hypothetical protein NDU88_002371 [Pleurodeles waltl]
MRHTAPPGVNGRWTLIPLAGELLASVGSLLHKGNHSTEPGPRPCPALRFRASAVPTRSVAGYVGLPLRIRGEPP